MHSIHLQPLLIVCVIFVMYLRSALSEYNIMNIFLFLSVSLLPQPNQQSKTIKSICWWCSTIIGKTNKQKNHHPDVITYMLLPGNLGR